MNMIQIGKNITALRKRKGYTQESLANKLNISPQAISKWETGTGLPEASLLIELSHLFNVSIDEILKTDSDKNFIQDFFNYNLKAPKKKILNNIPKISRWNPPENCDMFYSMPAMIAEALCCIEAYEEGRSEPVVMSELNEYFYDLMHITGIGYGFLWEDDRHMIEELWRIHDYKDMSDRVMRYYGRNYLWIDKNNSSVEEMRNAVIHSIDRGRPVVMEWPGGIPEFNIVTGYENDGETLIGYTYCEECAAKTNELGMFINPARWNDDFDFKILIIGDKKEPSYCNKDSMLFALDILNQSQPQHKEYVDFKYTAGDKAFQKWLDSCDTPEHTLEIFTGANIFTHALYMNSIYTQKCIQKYFKKLSISNSRKVNDTIIQIGITIDFLSNERNNIFNFKDKPEDFMIKARQHIENLIKHRKNMRDWLNTLYELL